MSKVKLPVSRSFAYRVTFLGSATSPGIEWPVTPFELSSPVVAGGFVDVQSRNDLLRERASTLDQYLSLLEDCGTGGSNSYTRYWIEQASELPADDREFPESLNTSDAVAAIRAALSLQVKELATVLGVERPTIYAWLRGEAQPQPQNRSRIAQLLKFAEAWNRLSKQPIGSSVRNELGMDGKSLVDLLAKPTLESVEIMARMENLAASKRGEPKGIHEIAERHGIDLSTVRQSQAEFDVLTGKPFHED